MYIIYMYVYMYDVQGELDEHEKLVEVLRQVDIVIVTFGVPLVIEQLKIIRAMKEAGNIKVNIGVITC